MDVWFFNLLPSYFVKMTIAFANTVIPFYLFPLIWVIRISLWFIR